MMLMGTPDSSASRNFWLILMMSTSLWVRSSSDLMPDSKVIEGLTETGGTGITCRPAGAPAARRRRNGHECRSIIDVPGCECAHQGEQDVRLAGDTRGGP